MQNFRLFIFRKNTNFDQKIKFSFLLLTFIKSFIDKFILFFKYNVMSDYFEIEDQTYLWTYWGAEDSANPELDVSYGLEREGILLQTFACI